MTYTIGFHVFTHSFQLTELPFLIGGVRGRPLRAALSPLPASRRPAVLLPSGYQERSHRSAVSRYDQSLLAGSQTGWSAETWAQTTKDNQTVLVCCYLANNPPSDSAFSMWENIQKYRRWLWVQKPIAHRNKNCSTVGWTKEWQPAKLL